MSGNSFNYSSSGTDDLYSDNEVKQFVKREGITNSNQTDLNTFANSMRNYVELDKSSKFAKDIISDNDNSFNILLNDVKSQSDTGSQITFQSQDNISNDGIINDEPTNMEFERKDGIFFERSHTSSQESVVLNENFIDQSTNFEFVRESKNFLNNQLEKNKIINDLNIDSQIVRSVFEEQKFKIKETLKKNIKFDLNSCIEKELDPEKILLLVNSIRNELKNEFKEHRILVNITIGENLSDNFQMGLQCYLNKTDVYGHYAFQNENIHLIASAYAILF